MPFSFSFSLSSRNSIYHYSQTSLYPVLSCCISLNLRNMRSWKPLVPIRPFWTNVATTVWEKKKYYYYRADCSKTFWALGKHNRWNHNSWDSMGVVTITWEPMVSFHISCRQKSSEVSHDIIAVYRLNQKSLVGLDGCVQCSRSTFFFFFFLLVVIIIKVVYLNSSCSWI